MTTASPARPMDGWAFFCRRWLTIWSCCLGAIWPTNCHAAPETFLLDASHTVPAFEVKHFGLTTQRGRFDRACGRIELDIPARRGSVMLTVETASIDIGSPTANRLLTSETMLNTERFPEMTFRSDKLVFVDDRVVAAEGTLTLAGVGKSIHLDVSGFACTLHPLFKRRLCGGNITATLRRSDFGLTRMLPDIGDVIRVDVPVEALAENSLASENTDARAHLPSCGSRGDGGAQVFFR